MIGRSRYLRKLGVAAFFAIAASLIALVAYLALDSRAAGREVASLETRRDELQTLADRLEEGRSQADLDRQIVLNLFGLCRRAEDVPDLQGNRVVAQKQGLEKLCFYAPAGVHKLEVLFKWKLKATSNEQKPADSPVGEQSWSVPLLADAGYFLTLTSDRQGTPVRWELTSNHPEFRTRTETVPLAGFSQRGSSWSGSGIIRFPNQIDRFSSELEAHLAAPPGLLLLDGTFVGVRQEQPLEIAIEVRLKSDGPACVPASEIQPIIILRPKIRLEPSASGKYLLRVPE